MYPVKLLLDIPQEIFAYIYKDTYTVHQYNDDKKYKQAKLC